MSNHELFAGARAVLALINGTDVSEIEVIHEGVRIFVRRFEVDEQAGADTTAMAQGPIAAAETEPARPASIVEITTPLTGIYYASPSPGAKSFVEEGDWVIPDQTVCLVEAMKVFNAISSKVTGRIVRILAKTGDLVKAGQALIEVDTADTENR